METVKGRVYKIFEKRQVTDKFALRQFVVQQDLVTEYGDYTKHYLIQAANKKIPMIDSLEVGQEVECIIAIDARKFDRKKDGVPTGEEGFMVNLNLIKLVGINGMEFTNNGSPVMATEMPEMKSNGYDDDLQPKEDDLPF